MSAVLRHTAEIVYDYVEDIDPNLTCAICRSALVDPVTTTSCKHTFCRDCITRAIQHNPQCPIDRSALTTHSLQDTEQLVKLMLDELKVKCAAVDCGLVMHRGLLLGHLRTCQKSVVTCQDEECGLSMARNRLAHHRAYECFQRKMECGTCGVMLTFRDRTRHMLSKDRCEEIEPESSQICEQCGEDMRDNQHHRWICTQARIPCSHAHRGCPAIIPRENLSSHLLGCPFEAMSAFFEDNEAKWRMMEDRTNQLQHQVNSLRSELSNVRARAAAVVAAAPRYAVGNAAVRQRDITPWVGVNRQPVVPSPPSTAAASTVVPPFDSLVAPPMAPTPADPAILVPVPVIAPASTIPRVTTPTPAQADATIPLDINNTPRASPPPLSVPIASTTSPGLQAPIPSPLRSAQQPAITTRAAADMAASNRGLFSPAFGSHQSHADYAFNRLPPGLDLTQIIEALRGVVLHMAAGIDTMERRNEVRTMTESLRILEEVGSLRAIVSTMRMQVMMDRPTATSRPMPVPSMPMPTPIDSDTLYGSSPPGSVPFASYHAHNWTFPPNTDSNPSATGDLAGSGSDARIGTGSGDMGTGDADLRNDSDYRVRESVVFTPSLSQRSGSTSSLVSTGSAGSRTGRGMPMGLPRERDMDLFGSVNRSYQRLSRANPISMLSRRMSQNTNGPRQGQ